MDDFKRGMATCKMCTKQFKWIGYKSVRSRISDPIYTVYKVPSYKEDEACIDLTELDAEGNISCYCPLCGYQITININE